MGAPCEASKISVVASPKSAMLTLILKLLLPEHSVVTVVVGVTQLPIQVTGTDKVALHPPKPLPIIIFATLPLSPGPKGMLADAGVPLIVKSGHGAVTITAQVGSLILLVLSMVTADKSISG